MGRTTPTSARTSPDEFALEKLHDEASNHRDRRHGFENAKLFTVTAILGLGGIKLGLVQTQDPLALTFTLFFAPFIAAIFDLFIFAEDYKVQRVLTFLRHHLRRPQALAEFGDRRGLLRRWVHWRSTYTKGESDARYYGSTILSALTVLPAAFAYYRYFEGRHYWLFVAWLFSAVYAIILVLSLAKSRYDEMVDDSENLVCPSQEFLRKIEEFFEKRPAYRKQFLTNDWRSLLH